MLAKSKLNSIETLMSQALIDLDISHEEFKAILKEKEKYNQMKENIKNIKSNDEKDELGENSKIIGEIVKMYKIKKKYSWRFCNFFNFLNNTRMLDINAKNYINAGVHVSETTNRTYFWVRMCDVKNGIAVENMSDLVEKELQGIFGTKNPIEKQIRKYKRAGKEWFNYNPYVYVRDGLMTWILMLQYLHNCISVITD